MVYQDDPVFGSGDIWWTNEIRHPWWHIDTSENG